MLALESSKGEIAITRAVSNTDRPYIWEVNGTALAEAKRLWI
jgi:hypothetical protein